MSIELEKLFGPDVLDAFDERMRHIAEQMAAGGDVGAVKVKTAAQLLDMHESRVRQLIREGRLGVIRPTPKTIRIPLSEIRRFAEGKK
jgi:excisionase family DNA binding protein